MRASFKFFVGLILVSLQLSPCLANSRPAYDGPMRFSTFWPCKGNASYCGVRILAEGIIQTDTGTKFASFVQNKKRHRHELPPVPTVVFNSPGGSLLGGMQLGSEIRNRGFNVDLASSYDQVSDRNGSENDVLIDKAVCASACVLAFSGGVKRSVEADSKMGIHQFSGTQGNIGDGQTQVTVVILAAYLEKMGINRGLLDRASLVPAHSIAWMTQDESRLYRLDNGTPMLSSWKIIPTKEGDPILEVLQNLDDGRFASVRIVIHDNVGLLSVTTIIDKTLVRPDRISQFPIGEFPSIDLCTKRRCIQTQPIGIWKRREANNMVFFKSMAAVSISDLREISQATSINISDNFGTATSDVSLTTDLSTDGLSSGIALLLKTSGH